MMKQRTLLLAGTLLALSACGKGQPVACTAESAQAPVVSIVKEQLEKLVAAKLRGESGTRTIGMSKIRAAIAALVVSIGDIRTSKEDPNSTRRFCTGSLGIRFPGDALADADTARAAANMPTVSDMAAEANVERAADRFTNDIEFNVQPTDDGSKVFAETDSSNAMFGFAAEVLASGLLRSSIEASQRETAQAAAQQSAEQNAALAQQRSANLASVRTDNQLAVQTIAASWKAIDPATRARLLPVQRAWIRKKDADCAVTAAAASVDPAERETARMTCDTQATQERITWLAQYRDDSAVPAPSASDEPEPRSDL